MTLSDSELHLAVGQYRNANPSRFPKGKLTSCHATDQGLELIFRSRDAARKIRQHRVSRSEAIRILIHFCLDQKLPLPRKGEKTFHVNDSKACLEIKLLTNLRFVADLNAA
jgi:hypothetical protein